jgi:hypothetical protein
MGFSSYGLNNVSAPRNLQRQNIFSTNIFAPNIPSINIFSVTISLKHKDIFETYIFIFSADP